MYIQITTACNMSCDHCIFGCAEHKRGEYMHPRTFKKAVKIAEKLGAYISIGGGEPTIHPKFWEFFGAAMAANIDSIWMATNGANTEVVKALAALASGSDKFACSLSVDGYHDPIAEETVQWFKKHDCEIRTVPEEHIVNKGSAAINEIGQTNECNCCGLFITPKGMIKLCGCDDAIELGHIDDVPLDVLDRANEICWECACSSKIEPEEMEYILTGKPIEEDHAQEP